MIFKCEPKDKNLFDMEMEIVAIDGKEPKQFFRDLVMELAKEEAEAMRKKIFGELKEVSDIIIAARERKEVANNSQIYNDADRFSQLSEKGKVAEWEEAKKLADNSQVVNIDQTENCLLILPTYAQKMVANIATVNSPEEKRLELPLLTDAQVLKCKFHEIDPNIYLCYVITSDLVMDETRSGPLYAKGDLFFKTVDLWNDNAPIFKWMDTTGYIHERNIKPGIIAQLLEEGRIGEYSPDKFPDIKSIRDLGKSPDAT